MSYQNELQSAWRLSKEHLCQYEKVRVKDSKFDVYLYDSEILDMVFTINGVALINDVASLTRNEIKA